MAVSEQEIAEEKANWHWRDSMRPARFFWLDGRAGGMFFILLFFPRRNVLILTILSTFFFNLLEKKGLSFPSSLRAARTWLLGPDRPALLMLRRGVFRVYKD